MHDLPRQKLSELLAKHGLNLCDDAKKLEGLLKDVLRNEYKRETFALISALREGVAYELRGSNSKMPPAALAEKLTRHLCDNLGLDDGVARWSVESWALALGVEITQVLAAPIKPVVQNTTAGPTPTPDVGVDLVALALQHRAKAEQDRMNAAEAAALAAQRQRDADIIAAQLENEAKANALSVHREAKQLAEQTQNFAVAAKMLEGLAPKWRDANLYENICGYRDKVIQLNAVIQRAVRNGRLRFLRSRVQELLKLQPKRDDMRRLLEVLPDEPELAKEFTNSIGMKFVLVEPGEFMMGSNEADNEKPPHMVEITQPFYLGVYPVTQAEYQAVMGTNSSHFTGNARLPVEQVSWDDAVVCAQKLSRLSAEQASGLTYRLPSEPEWEYACGAGSTGKWCFGDQESQLVDYAWFDRNSGKRTHPVGEKKPNAWGLYDMHGNVWEWNYPTGVQTDPQGPTTGSSRVIRGGGWATGAAYCRSASRSSNSATGRSIIIGFRLALSPSGQ